MSKDSTHLVFNEAYWAKAIREPNWYLEFVPYAKNIREKFGKDSEEISEFNKTIRHFFEKKLEERQVALAKDGPDLDVERQPVDTIVIHHTSAEPGERLSYINTIQLLNIYSPYFMNPTVRGERNLRGTAIWSGHFRDDKQVFYGYHWLMRMDGTFEQLLDDNQIGWHAGNWAINKRSIAICLDNDYEKQDPPEEILRKLATHIKSYYPKAKIIGHCEARKDTICPGTNFLQIWKPKLLDIDKES